MSTYTREERVDGVTPTLRTGLSWLHETEQPADALLQPQGLALPIVTDRRFIFVPDVGGRGAAVMVHVTPSPSQEEVVEALTDEELEDLAAALTGAGGEVHTRVLSASSPGVGRLQLSARAHPSLLAAVTRYRAGCPRHHLPACGDIRNAQCDWFARGFARLITPVSPLPWRGRGDDVVAASVSDSDRHASSTVASLDAANQRRCERAAAQAVVMAVEAISTLLRRERCTARTEESLRVLQLRVDHPGFSLRELGAAHDPPLTKDAYAARLRRALRHAGPKATQVSRRHPHAA